MLESTSYEYRALTYPCDDIEKYRKFNRLVHNDHSSYAKFDKMDIQFVREFMRPAFDFVKEHDIPYSVWNYLSTSNDGNRFSLVDDDKRLILSDEMARIIRGKV